VSSSNVRHGSLLARPTVIVGDGVDDREGGKGLAGKKQSRSPLPSTENADASNANANNANSAESAESAENAENADNTDTCVYVG
jgi:hypothetical protein